GDAQPHPQAGSAEGAPARDLSGARGVRHRLAGTGDGNGAQSRHRPSRLPSGRTLARRSAIRQFGGAARIPVAQGGGGVAMSMGEQEVIREARRVLRKLASGKRLVACDGARFAVTGTGAMRNAMKVERRTVEAFAARDWLEGSADSGFALSDVGLG